MDIVVGVAVEESVSMLPLHDTGSVVNVHLRYDRYVSVPRGSLGPPWGQFPEGSESF